MKSADMFRVFFLIAVPFIKADRWTENMTYVTLTGKVCGKCPPGTFWEADCFKEYSIAKCSLCTWGTYSNEYNRALKCKPCSPACSNPKMIVTQQCTVTSDTVCQCPSNHYHSVGRGGGANLEGRAGLMKGLDDCIPHTKCHLGYGVVVAGTITTDTVCTQCSRGCTFSDVISSSEHCLPCKVCDDLQSRRSECDVDKDAVCADQSQMINVNATFTMVERQGTNMALIIGLGIAFLVTAFMLVVVFIKLCQARNNNKKLNGVNGPYGSSLAFTDRSSVSRSVSRYSALTYGGYTYDSKASNLSINLPSASDYQARQRGSMSTVHFPMEEEAMDWESQYDNVFSFVARQLSANWKNIVYNLLSDACPATGQRVVDQLECEKLSLRDKLYEGLSIWKNTAEKEATPQKLLATLNALEYYGVAIKLRKRFPDLFNDDDDEDDRETDL